MDAQSLSQAAVVDADEHCLSKRVWLTSVVDVVLGLRWVEFGESGG